MLCEQCKQNQATIHYTHVLNGEKTEMNLCAACAQQHGAIHWQDVSSLLAGLLDNDAPPAPSSSTQQCSRCGLAYEQFRRTGMLGCAQCYQDFRKLLGPVLQRIHGRLQHEGHVPATAGEGVLRKRQIEALRRDLQGAIDSEEFERAAALRDQLRDLQRQHDEAAVAKQEG
jgi:protein arginine kinase activator